MTNHLRKFREKKGITQVELAEAIGATQESISNLERGRNGPSLSTAINICAVLGESVNAVFPISRKNKKRSKP